MNGEHNNPWDDDLDLSLMPGYVIKRDGLYEVKTDRNGEPMRDEDSGELLLKKIACRPIWPSGDAEDIMTDDLFIELSWINHRGRRLREWIPSSVRNYRRTLQNLPESPVTLENVKQISTWLTVAAGAIRGERQRVVFRRLAREDEILRAERLKREEASRER